MDGEWFLPTCAGSGLLDNPWEEWRNFAELIVVDVAVVVVVVRKFGDVMFAE